MIWVAKDLKDNFFPNLLTGARTFSTRPGCEIYYFMQKRQSDTKILCPMLYDKSEITIVIIIFVFPSLTHILVKLLYEHGVEIFYIPSNRFCIIPQILNDFHLEFKPLDLRT